MPSFKTITKEGVGAVTHRRIGQEAGVSHGVVSYHYPTRDELIYKSLEHHLGTVDEYLEQTVWQPNDKMTRKPNGLITAFSGVLSNVYRGQRLDTRKVKITERFRLLTVNSQSELIRRSRRYLVFTTYYWYVIIVPMVR